MSFRTRRPASSIGCDLLLASHGVEGGAAGLAFREPLAGEAAVADFFENPLHFGLGLGSDDPRAAGIIAVFRGVRDHLPHLAQPALVDQVDDLLQFVDANQVGDLRLIAGLDERLEGGLA